MNKEFKMVLGKRKSLVELVALVYRLLMKLRHNQERDEFINMDSFPGAVTHLVDLEIQASSIFKHDVFKWIVREIKKGSFITLKQGAECHEDGSCVYKVSVYKQPEFDHTVVYHPEKETDSAEDPIMVCSYRMFQYRGVPCRHMFTVMKNEHIFELHKSLIVKRWTKDARTVCEIPYSDQSMPREALEVSRKEKEKAEKSNENDERNTDPRPSVATPAKRSCGYCKQSGHNTQTCDVRKEKEKAEKTNENVTGTSNDPPPSVVTLAKKTIHCSACKGAGHTHCRCPKKTKKGDASPTSEE
ncbi:hypothetical protein ACLB2K_035494 [Fragaria x ananassa]